MVYITVRQPPMFHQMTLEELLFQDYKGPKLINTSDSNTRTYEFEYASEHFTIRIDVGSLITKLTRYNQSTEELRSSPHQRSPAGADGRTSQAKDHV